MANCYLFSYTRTRFIDYRNIFGVDYEVCPETVQNIMLEQVRALLNNSNDSNLNTPVHVCLSHSKFRLWGIVCLNRILNEDYSRESTNGRVRGFFGVLLTPGSDATTLPYSLDFYAGVYARYVVPQWDSYTFHYRENVELDIAAYRASEVIAPSKIDVLNIDAHRCRLFGTSHSDKELLAEALAATGNVTIATSITDESQAISADRYALMNALLRNNTADTYTDVPVHTVAEKPKQPIPKPVDSVWTDTPQDGKELQREDANKTSISPISYIIKAVVTLALAGMVVWLCIAAFSFFKGIVLDEQSRKEVAPTDTIAADTITVGTIIPDSLNTAGKNNTIIQQQITK